MAVAKPPGTAAASRAAKGEDNTLDWQWVYDWIRDYDFLYDGDDYTVDVRSGADGHRGQRLA